MNMYLMFAIAALACFVGTGFIWFGWSALENVIAMRSSSAEEESPAESAEA